MNKPTHIPIICILLILLSIPACAGSATTTPKASSGTNTPAPMASATRPPTSTPIPPPTPTPLPTATPLATVTPFPTNTPLPSFSSGGLGLTIPAWETLHGAGTPDQSGFGILYENKYLVVFQADKVWYVEHLWGRANAVTLEDARAEAQTLIPADSRLIRTYSPDQSPELIVDLYKSETLAGQFDPKDSLTGDWWSEGEPGNFVAIYGVYDYGVSRMIINLGNNP